MEQIYKILVSRRLARIYADGLNISPADGADLRRWFEYFSHRWRRFTQMGNWIMRICCGLPLMAQIYADGFNIAPADGADLRRWFEYFFL
jgi:hypothetical protein